MDLKVGTVISYNESFISLFLYFVTETESDTNICLGFRASDSDIMLDELKVPEDARLKCHAHILLAIENCEDKIFRDCETKIGN